MALSDSDIAFAVDLFEDLGPVTTRKMFGGMCLYHEGTVFALMSSEPRLYIKTRDPVALMGAATARFHTMPYHALPEDALDDPARACSIARDALDRLREEP